MGSMIDALKIVVIVQLFFSFCITGYTYSLPEETLPYVTAFSTPNEEINLNSTGQVIEDSLQTQTNIPVLEVGTLVFYSGNILMDLILNFAFAVPEMLGLLTNGIMLLFNVDSFLFATIELFTGVLVVALYFIGLMQMLAGMRSGRVI